MQETTASSFRAGFDRGPESVVGFFEMGEFGRHFVVFFAARNLSGAQGSAHGAHDS